MTEYAGVTLGKLEITEICPSCFNILSQLKQFYNIYRNKPTKGVCDVCGCSDSWSLIKKGEQNEKSSTKVRPDGIWE